MDAIISVQCEERSRKSSILKGMVFQHLPRQIVIMSLYCVGLTNSEVLQCLIYNQLRCNINITGISLGHQHRGTVKGQINSLAIILHLITQIPPFTIEKWKELLFCLILICPAYTLLPVVPTGISVYKQLPWFLVDCWCHSENWHASHTICASIANCIAPISVLKENIDQRASLNSGLGPWH